MWKKSKTSQTYMDIANGIERKKCGILDNHVCPLVPSKARKGESCDGCSLFEKLLTFRRLSLGVEERLKEGGK